MKNRYGKLLSMISHPMGRKQIRCMKKDFCGCSAPDIDTVCKSCGDENRIEKQCYEADLPETP